MTTINATNTSGAESCRIFTPSGRSFKLGTSAGDLQPECGNSSTNGLKDMMYRFSVGITGITGGDDITVANVNWPCRSTELGTMVCKVFCEEATSPTMPTSATDADGRPRTAAGTDFTAYTLSGGAGSLMTTAISILSSMEEVVETDGFTPTAFNIWCDDNGSGAGVDNYGRFYSADQTGAADPTLDITFTPAAAGARRVWVVD